MFSASDQSLCSVSSYRARICASFTAALQRHSCIFSLEDLVPCFLHAPSRNLKQSNADGTGPATPKFSVGLGLWAPTWFLLMTSNATWLGSKQPVQATGTGLATWQGHLPPHGLLDVFVDPLYRRSISTNHHQTLDDWPPRARPFSLSYSRSRSDSPPEERIHTLGFAPHPSPTSGIIMS